MEFSELELHPDIMRGVRDAGYVTCMPVQEQVFAHSFAGEDIYAQSQTGTGKTAAFLISIFQRMMTDPQARTRKTLIITPTRELAVQIDDEAKKLGKYLDLRIGSFYGGVSYGPQLDMLRANVEIIIGTPGRIIDLIMQGKMLLNEVGFLVVDEADRMFDMGFIDDIRKLMRYLPPAAKRQTFLFSATLGMRIKDLAWEWMRPAKEIAIEPEHVTVDLVTQELYHVGTHEKFRLLLGILDREKPRSALIFCNQKYMVEEIARRLQVNGVECDFIMGDLPQSKRQAIIDRLKAGGLEILVATDVASRGLDVQALDLVVNYDLPDEAESYVHRIGRTARAGKAGKAVSFACEKFVFNLPSIEKFIGNKVPVAPFDTALLLEDRSTRINWRRTHDYDRSRSREGGDAFAGRSVHARRGAGGRDDRRERFADRPQGSRAVREPRGQDEPAVPAAARKPSEPRAVPEGAAPGSAMPTSGRQGGARPGRAAPAAARPGPGKPAANRPAPAKPASSTPAGTGDAVAAGRSGNAGGSGAARQADPYSLSSEERMRTYREKFASAGPTASSGSGTPQAGKAIGPRPARAQSGGGAAGRPRPGKPSDKPEGKPARKPEVKPGLLDRIKGLFKPKG